MSFKKGLNKHLKNTAYKYSLVNKPTKNSYYILYSYTLVPARRDNSFKFTKTLRTIKNI